MTEKEYYIKLTKAKTLSPRFIRACMDNPKFRARILEYIQQNSVAPSVTPTPAASVVLKRVSSISISDTDLLLRAGEQASISYNIVSYKGDSTDDRTDTLSATFGDKTTTIDLSRKIISIMPYKSGTYNLVVTNVDGDIVYNKAYTVLTNIVYSTKILNRPERIDSDGFVIIDIKSTVQDENGTRIWNLPNIDYDTSKFVLETTTLTDECIYRLKFTSTSTDTTGRVIRIGGDEIRLSVVRKELPITYHLLDTSLIKDDPVVLSKDSSLELVFKAYQEQGAEQQTVPSDFVVEYDNEYLEVTREDLPNFYYKLTVRVLKQVKGRDVPVSLKVSYNNIVIMRNAIIKKIPSGRVIFGTHNSCTFAKFAGNIFQKALESKSTCQRINLYEQYDMGVRYFDLRPKCSWRHGTATDDGYTYHGWGKYKFSVDTALDIINKFPERCYVRLYHEGDSLDAFVHFVKYCKEKYTNILYYNTWGRGYSHQAVIDKMKEIGCPEDVSLRDGLVERQCHGDFGANLLISSPLGWAQDHNVEYYNKYKQEAENSGTDQLCIFDFVDKLRNV